jgi:hypothetical protein
MAPFSLRVFGSPLETVMRAQARSYPTLEIPYVVVLLTNMLRECRGFETEGIFRHVYWFFFREHLKWIIFTAHTKNNRISAETTRIGLLKVAIERGTLNMASQKRSLSSSNTNLGGWNPHEIACVLKLWLDDLPQPIIDNAL